MGKNSAVQGWSRFITGFTFSMHVWAAATLAVLMLLTGAHILGRVFRYGIPGAVEITEVLMAPIVFGSLAYAYHLGCHIKMEVVTQRLPARVVAALGVLEGLIGGGFIALISWRLFLWAWEAWQMHEVTQGILDIPIFPFRFISALGLVPFALLFFGTAIRSFRKAAGWKGD